MKTTQELYSEVIASDELKKAFVEVVVLRLIVGSLAAQGHGQAYALERRAAPEYVVSKPGQRLAKHDGGECRAASEAAVAHFEPERHVVEVHRLE